jgi:hypothetical protein
MNKRAVALLALIAVAAACDAGAADFSEHASKHIMSPAVTDVAGIEFSDASCEDPASTDVGTVFTCTASGPNGESYSFDVEISAEDQILVKTITQNA